MANSHIGASNFPKVSIEEFPSAGSDIVKFVVEDAGSNLGPALKYEGYPGLTHQPVVT